MKKNWKNPALYKTRLCDNWALEQPCRYGTNCWYAHGPRELRNVPHLDNDPVAKTESLSQVLEMLPSSRVNSSTMNQINEQKNNADLDVFRKVTVPVLNAMVAKMAAGQAPIASSPSAQQVAQVMSLLMRANGDAAQHQMDQNLNPDRYPSEMRPSFMQAMPNCLPQTHPSNNFGVPRFDSPQFARTSSSPFSGSISPTYSPKTVPDTSLEDENDDERSFELIRQRLEGDLDNLFT